MNQIHFVPLRSQRFIVTLRYGDVSRKLLQVMFVDREGGVYVAFPYYKSTDGLVAVASIPAGREERTVHLEEHAKITSHLVKYSHHSDGEAHFSQDGRVKTEIRKQSVPLKQLNGHLFTVVIEGLTGFEIDSSRSESVQSLKRTILRFDSRESVPDQVKITGFWYSTWHLARMNQHKPAGQAIGPKVLSVTESGDRSASFILAPPVGSPNDDHLLLLSYELSFSVDSDKNPSLWFIGGFDHEHRSKDLSADSSFLVCKYPVANTENLSALLTSIDLENREQS